MSEETFGQVLRRLRGNRTLEAVAKAAGISTSYVYKLENEQRKPTRTVVEALEAATNARGALIEAIEEDEKRRTRNAEFSSSIDTMGPVRTLERADTFYGEDATERRRLLQIAAGLGALGPTEALRQLIDLNVPAARTLEDWELACADHLHAIRYRPPAQAQVDIHIDLAFVLNQLQQTTAQHGVDHRHTRDLHRVLAALSTVHANMLTRLGEHGAAIRWWRTARAAADSSGDLYLQLGVRSTEAGHGVDSGQRAPEAVLRLLDAAQPLMDRVPGSYGAALIDYTRARTLAMIGRHQEARATLERISERLMTGSLPASIMPAYWRAGQLPYARVWVYSAAGDIERAGQARDEVIASNPDYQFPAIAKLLTAQCTVVAGNVDEGMREAAGVMDDLPDKHRTTMVIQAARMALCAVPVEQRARPAVRDVRSLLAIED
ncbi:helix-turn-helix transcriptional regulator [Nonomuraea sp. NPDC048892]|uniref:helix-turn-helix domain-containing protein n=1 Tax=Nonomuraea sp. NPDC048892 TaxID=3154624 RepID=UPI0033C0D9CB